MKSIAISAAVGLGLLATPALAADMSYPVKAPPVVVVPMFSWTGFYIGGNVGYGGDKFRYPYNAYADVYRPVEPQVSALQAPESIVLGEIPYYLQDSYDLSGQFQLNSSGFFGGGQIGYNYQFDNSWVIGAEADFEWSGIEGKLSGNGNLYDYDYLLGGLNFSAGSEVEWFGTIRARLGYAWDRAFLYATGGGAYGKVKSSASFSVYDGYGDGFGGSVSKSDTQWGWTVGLGLEYALTDHWTFKTEYLYVDLGSQTLAAGEDSGFVNEREYVVVGGKIDVETKFHTIKAGVNYKF